MVRSIKFYMRFVQYALLTGMICIERIVVPKLLIVKTRVK